MSEYRLSMGKAIREQGVQLAHLRRYGLSDALRDMGTTFTQNARDSHDSEDRAYWLLMLEMCDREIASAMGDNAADARWS